MLNDVILPATHMTETFLVDREIEPSAEQLLIPPVTAGVNPAQVETIS